jgi:tRNA(Ile)-lysidine synthase
MLRGTGLRGLTGISNQVGRVVRPLLFATRKQILEYAIRKHIHFREDSSNHTQKYLRNKIRIGMLPMIREINPRFTSIMRGTLYHLTDAEQFIEAGINKIKQSVLEHCDNNIDRIHTTLIEEHFPEEFVIYKILNSEYGFKGDVVDALCHALDAGATGRRFYSREWVAVVDRGDVVVAQITDEDSCETIVEKGVARSYIGGSVLYYEYCNIDFIDTLDQGDNVALLDADKLKFPLRVRRWQEGDWFVPFGMSGRKKLSDYLIDKKVSMAEKSRQFVLLSGDDIVWVVGRRLDDRYAITRKTENVLKVTRYTL